MGGIHSNRNTSAEEVDTVSNNAYRYPPKSGCYFGNYFTMGGERFDTTQPETYLFGENHDLNFLGCRPMTFPYPAPQANEPTKTLKSLINIRKDSLHFVKAPDAEESSTQYNIEFTFDSDVRVGITVHYFATEEIQSGYVSYKSKDPNLNSETFHYKRGANQTFVQTNHIIDPSKFSEDEWQYNPDKEVFPIVIHCVVEDDQHSGTHHSHSVFAIVEHNSDGQFMLKPLKQKQMVDGLCYLLQEIYGIENKNAIRSKALDEDLDDNSLECVICMSDVRDTLILPCRHLCLCNCCADSLRYQANNCPICRAPFRALLQIRAMRRKQANSTTPAQTDSEDGVSQQGVPAGYEAVSLIEALNGPFSNNVSLGQHRTDSHSRPTSLPTSPDESPIMTKRKSKSRQTSILSNQSRVVDTVVEEGAQVNETTALNSPEAMTDTNGEKENVRVCEDSVRSRSNSSKKRKEHNVDNRHRDCHATESKTKAHPPEEPKLESHNDSEEGSNIIEDAVQIINEVQSEDTSSVKLSKSCNDLKDGNKEGSAAVGSGDNKVGETTSLPGTPSLTDGSSYSSTSSSRMLLSQGGGSPPAVAAHNANIKSAPHDSP